MRNGRISSGTPTPSVGVNLQQQVEDLEGAFPVRSHEESSRVVAATAEGAGTGKRRKAATMYGASSVSA